MGSTRAAKKPLSEVLPPLILGTGTFNTQFHPDPSSMPYTSIVRAALSLNINAFDTSPYYGPSEILLGDALKTIGAPRESYFILTKAGRIIGDQFDYSPEYIRYSVCRSLDRLHAQYLDLVYTHDVEFVSPAEVLAAVQELRKMRDEGLVRYVGISGYPIDVLADLAEMILEETSEPLDAVMSYGHYTIQNARLGQDALLQRFVNAGVKCLPNASMLGLGLLTTRGVETGPIAEWHPAPKPLRAMGGTLSSIAKKHGMRLEMMALRWAMENWAKAGARLGSTARGQPTGISVMAVLSTAELEENNRIWEAAVEGASEGHVDDIVKDEMWPALGKWRDHSWESGGPGFKNARVNIGEMPDDETAKKWGLVRNGSA